MKEPTVKSLMNDIDNRLNKEANRLEVYDRLRDMHSILKDIPDRSEEWEKSVLGTVSGVLYMAEAEFARDL